VSLPSIAVGEIYLCALLRKLKNELLGSLLPNESTGKIPIFLHFTVSQLLFLAYISAPLCLKKSRNNPPKLN
jgi:hypothetical protein